MCDLSHYLSNLHIFGLFYREYLSRPRRTTLAALVYISSALGISVVVAVPIITNTWDIFIMHVFELRFGRPKHKGLVHMYV